MNTRTVSLLPFSEKVSGITTHGMQYPLNEESLEWGTTRGISNVCISDSASVEVKSGRVKKIGGSLVFKQLYPEALSLIIGSAGLSLESFLTGETVLFI